MGQLVGLLVCCKKMSAAAARLLLITSALPKGVKELHGLLFKGITTGSFPP